MDKELVRKIHPIAKRVRSWAESLWMQHGSVGSTSNLMGCCVIASAKLFTELKNAGFQPKIYMSEYHGYVVVDDLIIDVTATQFNIDTDVFFTTIKRAKKFPDSNILSKAYGLKHDRAYMFSSIGQVISHQKATGWPDAQSVLTFKELLND